MRLRSVLLFVALVSVVTTAAIGTQGYSTARLERGMTVGVVADEAAYLGYTAEVDTERILTVNLSNTVSDDQTLDVDVVVSNGTTTETRTTTLSPGQQRELAFADVSCDATIDVVATGQTVRIELTRPVPCDGSTSFTADDGEGGDG